MINLKEACKIVCENNKDMRPESCMELEEYYSFNMIPKNLAPRDGFANSSVYLVNKQTGEHEIAYFTKVNRKRILHEYYEEDLKF